MSVELLMKEAADSCNKHGILTERKPSVQLTSLSLLNPDQMLLILKLYVYSFTKQAVLMRSTVLSLSLQLSGVYTMA